PPRVRWGGGAGGLPDRGLGIAQLAREQLENGRVIVEIVGKLATDTQLLTRGQKDLRRHIDRIHGGAAQIAGLENEVTARLAAVNDAAVKLREELARLRAAP